MNFNDLTADQKNKLSGRHTPEEILALAKEEGYELSDAELESIAGGEGGWDDFYDRCPKCGSYNVGIVTKGVIICKDCEYTGRSA